ncbi:MAG: TIGR02391 family protein [Methylotenera sp.]
MKYCQAELLDEDYFHAVLEAAKGLSHRIKMQTGHDVDGQELIDRVFGGNEPMWVINDFACESHRMEQKGFMGVCKGMIGMFRNPLAHEPRAYWHMSEQDAADALSFLSLIHRRLDNMRMPPRTILSQDF